MRWSRKRAAARVRPRDLLELRQQRTVRCDLIVDGIEPRRDHVPFLRADALVSHLLGHRHCALGGAPARVELLLEGGQADLDGLRRAGGCALLRRAAARRSLFPCGRYQLPCRELRLLERHPHVDRPHQRLDGAPAQVGDLDAHGVVRQRRAPADHSDQRGDRQQAEGDLEPDTHVLRAA